ncbi:MAG: Stp1/IreP family PP2C-type Ser/Thr phosphatase [Clostridiales bacterium]|nr:Stp1/IreP family PP2C-type Ser/Thr phosphatase [Clostridiales bacterium]
MEHYGKTHVGLVRQVNQDCFEQLTLPEGGLLAMVCDGMGGPGGGEVASAMAVEWIANRLLSAYRPEMEDRAVLELLLTATEEANYEIFLKGSREAEHSGMGTTAVMALVRGQSAGIVSVGDSRAYLFTNMEDGDRLIQITHDHSVVQELVDAGNLTAGEARTHPKRNIITRALGTQRHVEADCFKVTLLPGDRLLLCSDGLNVMVDDDRLLSLIGRNDTVEDTVHGLIDAALKAGATDNVTAVLISV